MSELSYSGLYNWPIPGPRMGFYPGGGGALPCFRYRVCAAGQGIVFTILAPELGIVFCKNAPKRVYSFQIFAPRQDYSVFS